MLICRRDFLGVVWHGNGRCCNTAAKGSWASKTDQNKLAKQTLSCFRNFGAWTPSLKLIIK